MRQRKYDPARLIEMRKSGMTYAAIGAALGVAKQTVYVACKGNNELRRAPLYDRIIYAGLKRYMDENKIAVKELAEKTGIANQNVFQILTGKNDPCKRSIDRILRATGLTYEEAFAPKGSD